MKYIKHKVIWTKQEGDMDGWPFIAHKGSLYRAKTGGDLRRAYSNNQQLMHMHVVTQKNISVGDTICVPVVGPMNTVVGYKICHLLTVDFKTGMCEVDCEGTIISLELNRIFKPIASTMNSIEGTIEEKFLETVMGKIDQVLVTTLEDKNRFEWRDEANGNLMIQCNHVPQQFSRSQIEWMLETELLPNIKMRKHPKRIMQIISAMLDQLPLAYHDFCEDMRAETYLKDER